VKALRKLALTALSIAALVLLAGCAASPARPTAAGGASVAPTSSAGTVDLTATVVGKTQVFTHETKVYDPADFPKAAMDGEPSRIRFFKPEQDEGAIPRDYKAYNAKTFKFLSLPGAAMIFPPQGYYLFDKNGGTLETALKPFGYKAVELRDSGHVKILPNLYLGYYDFAWVSLNVLTEYWSGHESMNQELWRGGNDYVVIGNGFNGGVSLMAPRGVTSVRQLDGKTVGIMNAAYNMEAVLDRKLQTAGLRTETAGGTVKVVTGPPGLVMNLLLEKKTDAVFAWGAYAAQLKERGFHELVKWQDLGYGERMPYEVLVVRRDILEKHPDVVQAVVQANDDATRRVMTSSDYKKHEYDEAEYYWSHYMAAPRKVADLNLGDMINFERGVNEQLFKDVYDYMKEYGFFKETYPYKSLVNLSFYDKVKK
jgi:ABC-type nitrate/sulfonate/bicarbonate transport system substrate-binding protein